MIRAWLAGLVAVAATASVRADVPPGGAPAPPAQGNYVVVVGVGSYSDPKIDARPTAEADARAVYDLYADPAYSLAKPERVVLLTGTPDEKRRSKPATRENVVAALHEAVAKTGKDDAIIVAMFGRGASAGDQTCLFTSETKFAERAKTGLLGSDLGAELKPAKDRKIALMLDVAFKGFDAGKETLAEPGLRDVFSAVFGTDRDADGEQPPPHDRVVMLASIPANPPLTQGDNGLFATTVLEALRGAADTEGYEPDGVVIVDELVKYVEAKIPTEARKIGKTNQEKEAVPFIVGEETAHFALSKNPKQTAGVEKRLGALAAVAKQLPPEVAAETEKLLGRMPKLKSQQELRKNAQQLADGRLDAEAFLKARAAIVASTRIAPEVADKYARTILRAIDAVQADYVKPITPGEWAALAVKGLYRRLEETVPETVAATLKDAKELPRGKIADLLRAVRTNLGNREDLEGQKDADTTITMMFAELRDPYTTYYDEALIKKMDAPLRGEFRGVGIQIRRDLVRDGLLVVSPIKGSPAYKAGIRAGDLISAIKRDSNAQGEPLKEGEPTEISTKGMKTESALEIILGKPGVPVTLTIEREGEQPKDYTIKRGVVVTETILGVKRDEKDDWTFVIDPDTKIGYVMMTQFTPSSAGELKSVVRKLKRDGMKGFVLDLRNNPGGVLNGAVQVCDLFLKDGVIVSVKPRTGRPQTYTDQDFGSETDFPMAVLINGNSASASEIVSACLQDYGRAVVVGERSYGKGSVQSVKDFSPTNGQIKLTTARYFPPAGRNIDKNSTPGKPEDEWGVKPDSGFEVKLSREEKQDFDEHYREREVIRAVPKKDAKVFKDRQLDAAVDYVRGQLKAAAGGAGPKAGGG